MCNENNVLIFPLKSINSPQCVEGSGIHRYSMWWKIVSEWCTRGSLFNMLCYSIHLPIIYFSPLMSTSLHSFLYIFWQGKTLFPAHAPRKHQIFILITAVTEQSVASHRMHFMKPMSGRLSMPRNHRRTRYHVHVLYWNRCSPFPHSVWSTRFNTHAWNLVSECEWTESQRRLLCFCWLKTEEKTEAAILSRFHFSFDFVEDKCWIFGKLWLFVCFLAEGKIRRWIHVLKWQISGRATWLSKIAKKHVFIPLLCFSSLKGIFWSELD